MPRRQRKTLKQQYYPYLRRLFEHRDGVQYAGDHVFTQEQLLSIRPIHLVRWMSKMAYGTETPGPNDAPTLRRSSGLGFCKKAISYFMPNKNTNWNIESESGNPTMSVAVNKLIKDIKWCEVRRTGKKSNAKRDLKRPEFRKTLRLLEGHDDFVRRYRTPAMMKLQFHIVARADDVCCLETADVREHEKFGDIAAQTKVSWSKNVLEERDCPDQILMGANDPDFCILLALACYFETRAQQSHGAADRFLFGEGMDDDEPIRSNERYRRLLETTWKDPEFVELASQVRGSLGSHSLRKFASTWPAEHGISQDDIEVRGRWKGGRNGRTVNRYINVEQLPTDGKVAAILSVGGPVKYALKEGSHVTHQFLMDAVVPGIRQRFSGDPNNKLPQLLALPLLWAAHQPGLEALMSRTVRDRIVDAYSQIREEHPADWNPVKKVPLVVTRIENQLIIDEFMGYGEDQDQAGDNGAALTAAQIAVGQRDTLHSLVNQVQQMRQLHATNHQQLQESISQLRGSMNERFSAQARNINRLALQAPRVRAPANANAGNGAAPPAPPARPATLSPRPRSVNDLWTEYMHGIGGRKPAKDFTHTEKGRCRFSYCRRKNVWDTIKRMVDAGIDHMVACDRIYQAYGHNKSVTDIINLILKDKPNGGHPNLRV